jgi:hypothetical protein
MKKMIIRSTSQSGRQLMRANQKIINNSCPNVDGKSLLEIGLSHPMRIFLGPQMHIMEFDNTISSVAKTLAGKSRSSALFCKNHLQKQRHTGRLHKDKVAVHAKS